MIPASKGGGRFLGPGDEGQNRIVISARTAADFPDAEGHPRKVGDTLRIGEESFEIVGIFDTGSLVLDRIIVMDLATARRFSASNKAPYRRFWSSQADPAQHDVLKAAIEQTLPEVKARSTSDMAVNITRVMNDLDIFLLMVISLAMVGCVGIINTMLMSTLERYVEFGILRTNGWKRRNVLQLILAESSYLGLLAGVLGCVLAMAGVWVANMFLSGGLKLAGDAGAPRSGSGPGTGDGSSRRPLPSMAGVRTCAHGSDPQGCTLSATHTGVVHAMIDVRNVTKVFRAGENQVEALGA